MPTARIAAAAASAVTSADTMVLLADARGVILAPALAASRRRLLTRATEAIGQGPITTLPGSVIGRDGSSS